jgi:two-component system, LytTR family, response regulator
MKQKLNALIVDDEESARNLLAKLLEETLCFSEIRFANSVSSANNELKEFDPDMIFLDIKMPGKDGFAIAEDLKHVKNKPGIVFVTAYERYAIRAIKYNAFDYLLKPVNRKELKQCVLKFIESRKGGDYNEAAEKSPDHQEKLARLRINTRTGTVFINPSSILYCKADGNYTTICTGNKKHLCSMNLGKIGEQLPGTGFIRIGRSHIINFEYITVLDRKESHVTLEREGESVTLKIPRQHLKDFDMI